VKNYLRVETNPHFCWTTKSKSSSSWVTFLQASQQYQVHHAVVDEYLTTAQKLVPLSSQNLLILPLSLPQAAGAKSSKHVHASEFENRMLQDEQRIYRFLTCSDSRCISMTTGTTCLVGDVLIPVHEGIRPAKLRDPGRHTAVGCRGEFPCRHCDGPHVMIEC